MNQRRYCSALNLDSPETVAYNNPLFPAYVRYGILSLYPDYSAVSHWHEDMEFILVKKGKMTYNVNGELIELSEDNGIMVNSRQIHHGFSAEHSECEFICVLFSPELFKGNSWFYENYIEYITGNSLCPYLCLEREGWKEEILEKLEMIYDSFRERAEDAAVEGVLYFELMESAVSIMKALYKNIPVPQKNRKKESSELAMFKSMITFVEEHYAENITLEEIASSGACCKSRCSLLFKKYVCDTPVSYATKYRLRKSLAALLDSDESITGIAYEYGFGGASYYCEVFRKYYGVSPLKYKKTHLGI